MSRVPSCKDCMYFVPGRYVHTDMCKRFIAYRGRGRVVYQWADYVRMAEHKCGPDGKLFVGRPAEKLMSRDKLDLLTRLFEEDE
jgi:hypothetical protein